MRTQRFVVSVLAASLLVASPARSASSGGATFGGQWWTQNAYEAKYREYREMPRGAYLEDYILRESNAAWTATLWGKNAFRDDQHNYLSVAHGVRFRVDGEYSGVPHLYSDIARTSFSQTSPGVFTLPDSVQRIMQAGGNTYTNALNDLLKGANPVSLGMQTNISKLRLRARPMSDWQFEVKGTQRQRSGAEAYGVTYGISSATMSEVATPIEQNIADIDATAIWTHQKAKVLASFGYSQFKNFVSTMRVDNSRRLTPSTSSGTAVAALDMWPDNSVLRGRASLTYELPRATLLAVTFGISQGKQDESLLPYTSNPTLAQSNPDSLPTKAGDEKFTETVFDAKVSGRPTQRVYGVLRFRNEKYEKKSEQFLFRGFSPYDAGFTVDPEENILWGSSRTTFGLDVDVDVLDWMDLSLLAEHRGREHDEREVTKDGENVFGAKVRTRPRRDVYFEIGGRIGDRTLDQVHLADYQDAGGVFVEPSGLRRYDVADRKQLAGITKANWSVNDRLDLAVEGNITTDDYDNSTYGLQRMENGMAWGDATWHVMTTLDLTGGYGFGQVLSRMESSEYSAANRPDTASTMDWWMNERDRNIFFFTQADWQAVPNKVRVQFDYTFTRAQSEFNMSNVTTVANGSKRAPAQDLPDTFYRSHDVMTECRYTYSRTLDFGLRYEYTAWKVDDFAVMNVPLLGGSISGGVFTPNAIYLGDSYQGYVAHRITLLANKRF